MAVRCKSGLSFRSLSSKSSGLRLRQGNYTSKRKDTTTYRNGIMYGNAATACTSEHSTMSHIRTTRSVQCSSMVGSLPPKSSLTSSCGQIMRRLNCLRSVRSLHLVTPEVLHHDLQLRCEVAIPDMHDVLLGIWVVEHVFCQGFRGWIRGMKLRR